MSICHFLIICNHNNNLLKIFYQLILNKNLVVPINILNNLIIMNLRQTIQIKACIKKRKRSKFLSINKQEALLNDLICQTLLEEISVTCMNIATSYKIYQVKICFYISMGIMINLKKKFKCIKKIINKVYSYRNNCQILNCKMNDVFHTAYNL